MLRIFVMLALMTPFSAFAQDSTSVDPSIFGLVASLISKIPANTVTWTLAIFALLNGLSAGLAKIASLTATKGDDVVAATLNKFLVGCQKAIDFVIAARR